MTKQYKLSNDADTDLEDIFDYTEKRHGLNQAIKYLNVLDDTLNNLCDFPNLGKLRNEIRQNLYSFVVKEHLIFYEITSKELLIIRILHASRDVPNHIKNTT